MDLVEKIIDFRARNRMSQDEFAKGVGIDRVSLVKIEGRKRKPHTVNVRRIEIFMEDYNNKKGEQ